MGTLGCVSFCAHPKKPNTPPPSSPLLLISLASSSTETFSRVVESSSLDETRTTRERLNEQAYFIYNERPDCAGQGANRCPKKRIKEREDTRDMEDGGEAMAYAQGRARRFSTQTPSKHPDRGTRELVQPIHPRARTRAA